jgi:hypothetical protein
MPLWFLWLLVPLAPALCVHGVDWAFWTLTGRAERFLPLSHALMLRAILVSLPFLVLAMVATYARKAATPGWTAAVGRAARLGIALNLLLWTVYLAVGAGTGGARGGAVVVALGIIALLSPVWIGYAMRRVIKGPRAAG